MSRLVAVVLQMIGYDHDADIQREQKMQSLSVRVDNVVADTEKTINTARIELYGGTKNGDLKHPHEGQQIMGDR